jgi:hypothetical protein
MRGRPGANVIRWITEWVVDGPTFEAFERAAQNFAALGWRQQVPSWWRGAYGLNDDSGAAVYSSDRNALGLQSDDPAARFVLGDGFGCHTRAHRDDVRRNIEAVAAARRMADRVIFSIHNHEGGDEPSEHVRELAHATIDAGADAVVGHGPHRHRGIEIYEDRPIFYSLGNFISESDTVDLLNHDRMVRAGFGHEHPRAQMYDAEFGAKRGEPSPYWWSVIPVATFESKRLCQIVLHPIELGFGLPRSQAGRPMLAEGSVAQQALERVQGLSKAFGTTVEIHDDRGIIRP